MLLQNYKVTIKNLLRSGIFWIMLVVTSFVSLNESFQYESKGYSRYIKWFSNCIGSLAGYALPLFTTLTVILILTRDYEDDFFEIEKSSNIKTSHYLLGRIFALFTVNFLVGFLLTFIAFYIPFLKNPLKFTGIIYFLLDSSERLMRQVLFVIVPQILFFLSVTYFLGTLTKSNKISGIISTSYLIFFYLSRRLNYTIDLDIYISYLSPRPNKTLFYLYYYDHPDFETTLINMGTSLERAIIGPLFLIVTSLVCILISYIFTYKRET